MTASPSSPGGQLDPYRLPADVTPLRYDVQLTPLLDEASFSGTVTVQLNVVVPTTTLVLNAAELEISLCLVNGAPADFTVDSETERLFVHTATELPTGSATLAVKFTGILNDKLRGFYHSTYTGADGAE